MKLLLLMILFSFQVSAQSYLCQTRLYTLKLKLDRADTWLELKDPWSREIYFSGPLEREEVFGELSELIFDTDRFQTMVLSFKTKDLINPPATLFGFIRTSNGLDQALKCLISNVE